MKKPLSLQDRREFLRTCARGTTLAVLGLTSFLLVKRRRGGLQPDEHRCTNRQVCCSCSRFKRCGLPAALSAKRGGAGTSLTSS